MRSRPSLSLFLRPDAPTPGSELIAELCLASRSDTPILGVVFRLTGTERTLIAGEVYREQHLLNRAAQTGPALLTCGEHRIASSFHIPETAPASYESSHTSIAYQLDVQVLIPWWPDRLERYRVPLRPLPPAPAPAPTPGLFCNRPGGPQGRSLYMEASLESTRVALGGVVHGAVSLSNLESNRVRRVEVAFVVRERPLVKSELSTLEVARYSSVLVDGAPQESHPVRFALRVPHAAPAAFQSQLVEVYWVLEIRAVIAWGTDEVIQVPMEVHAPAPVTAGSPSQPLAHLPPVGQERRALVWSMSAAQMGFDNDAERERMSGAVGPMRMSVALEQRDAGLHRVATLAWPALGLDVHVAEKRWMDFADGLSLRLSPLSPFAKRFVVRGREQAQVLALLDEAVRDMLVGFDQVALDDEGAQLASAGAANSVDELNVFLTQALAAARALERAMGEVPPPAAMAPFCEAWREFATRVKGRFEIGRLFVHDGSFEGERVEAGTEWSEGGAPASTVLRLRLGALLERPIDLNDTSTLPAVAMSSLRRLMGSTLALRVGPDVVESVLAAPCADPRTLEPTLAAMAALARALRGVGTSGPYR